MCCSFLLYIYILYYNKKSVYLLLKYKIIFTQHIMSCVSCNLASQGHSRQCWHSARYKTTWVAGAEHVVCFPFRAQGKLPQLHISAFRWAYVRFYSSLRAIRQAEIRAGGKHASGKDSKPRMKAFESHNSGSAFVRDQSMCSKFNQQLINFGP